MGCMNGKCSDETDSPEEGGLIPRQQQPRIGEYSVRPLPETPSIQNRQGLHSEQDDTVVNSGSQELRDDYLITSTPPPRGIDKKTGTLAAIGFPGIFLLLLLSGQVELPLLAWRPQSREIICCCKGVELCTV